jgi:periplasmic protein TonB
MTSESGTHLTPVATLVIWMTCMAVGLIGLRIPYPRPWPAMPPAAPVMARLVNVQITAEPAPRLSQRTPMLPQANVVEPSPPPMPAPLAEPAEAPMMAIATPVPLKTISMPPPAPAPIAPVATVATTHPTPPTEAAPSVQQITFGQGEGAQPAPDYPIEAQLDGEQGTVVVQLTVAADGHVASAAVVSPSPWPLLNQSAVRAVRETWQFSAGPVRIFEVAIQFKGQ